MFENTCCGGTVRLLFKPFLIAALTTLALISTVNPLVAAEKSANSGPGANALPLLVDVGADKCIPCIMMAPILEELKKEYKGSLDVVFVDAWKKPEEANKYRVRMIPTQIFYNASGKELYRHSGFMSKEDILSKLGELNIQVQKVQK
jgi:thioredoxin 1